jgi:O-antigen/teichoic acid export membrane protein
MARGAVWMVLFKVLDRSLGVISTMILSRLLAPEDFGLVAMATSLIALLELFAMFGLETALIQRPIATREHFNSAWTLNVLAGASIATMMLALAWPAAFFYHETRVTRVICTLAVGAMLQGFENVGVVNFRKEMRFEREFRFLMLKKLMMFAIVIPLAFTLRSYWALVLGMVLGRACGLALSYVVHPFRPRLSLSAVRDLMHISKWLLLTNMIGFLRDRSSDFVVGRLAGPASLGVFSVSAEISAMPGTELVAPINRAVLPAYVKLAQDLPALRREYLSVMGMIALFATPAVAGLAVCAPFLVLLLLGPKWVSAALLIQVLAFYGIVTVLQSNAYSAFLALSKPQVFVKINGIHVAILLPLLIGLTYEFGVVGAAWAYVGAAAAILPVNFLFITRYLGLQPTEFIGHLWRPLSATALMYGGVRLLGPPLPGAALPTTQAATSLFTCIALGFALYVLSDTVLWLLAGRPEESAESHVLHGLPRLWNYACAKLGR